MPRQARGQQKLFEKKLFYGDNLDILRAPEHFSPESVDLVYLDPPFKPNEKYNLLFRDLGDGEVIPSASQVRAFEDTWQWGSAARGALNDVKENSPHHVRESVEALHAILGFSNMFAYLVMMAPRLVELHRVMKPTASIYLHCDSAASHYLKVLMDAVFGPEQFHNEIIWKRTSGHSDARRYGRVHDVILFYAKTDQAVWNQIYQPYDEEYVVQYYRYKDPDGRRFMSGDLGAAGLSGGGYTYEWKGVTREWRLPVESMRRLDAEGGIYYTRNGIPRMKRYLDLAKGMPAQDLWSDIEALRSWHVEKLGYPTQKPKELLERIIQACSDPGAVVLDPFCGCGTTIAAAEDLGRNWLGIDVTYDAIPIIRDRLMERGLQDGKDYEVEGAPTTMADAEKLARENAYQFQWWAVRRLGGRETENIRKKGADKGVDGRLTLVTDAKDRFPEAIISVKAGQTGPAHVRELAGTIKAQKADVGVLVVLKPPTKGMREAAEVEGGYPGRNGEWCPRLQILTAEDIIAGVGVKAPSGVAIPKMPTQPKQPQSRTRVAARKQVAAKRGQAARKSASIPNS